MAKVEIRCGERNCNRLLMNYFTTGKDMELHLGGFELKCEKCKRIFRLKDFRESSLLKEAVNGIVKV